MWQCIYTRESRVPTKMRLHIEQLVCRSVPLAISRSLFFVCPQHTSRRVYTSARHENRGDVIFRLRTSNETTVSLETRIPNAHRPIFPSSLLKNSRRSAETYAEDEFAQLGCTLDSQL